MKSVKVHPTKRRAYVDPGATLGDLDHETQAFGLATPVGGEFDYGCCGAYAWRRVRMVKP